MTLFFDAHEVQSSILDFLQFNVFGLAINRENQVSKNSLSNEFRLQNLSNASLRVSLLFILHEDLQVCHFQRYIEFTEIYRLYWEFL